MKRFGIGILASCFLVLSLTACGSGSTSAGTVSNDAANGLNTDDKVSEKNDNSSSTGGKKTIVFSTFFPDARFQEAKKKYEKLHPNIEIKLEDVKTDDSHLEAEMNKYVTTMNTAMLAGKGPDLLQMDLLPTDNYAKHKLLTDLSPMMDQDSAFKKEDYFSNILDNVRTGNALYSMPLSFFLTGFAGDENVIAKTGVSVDDKSWSWIDFMKTSKQLVASKAFPYALAYGDPEYLLADIVIDNYSLFVDAASHKANFESASFTGLMNQVKSMYDDNIVRSDGRGNAYFSDIQINSPWDYLVTLREYGEHMKLFIKPHAQDTTDGGYFRTYRDISLTSNSKVKSEAWDFLKFMMSEEIQTPPTTAGFPINKKVFSKQIQQLKEEGTIQAYQEGPLHGLTFKVDQAKLGQLESFVNGAIHHANFKSDKVRETIINESKAFFTGQKSADDVARVVQNKVNTYLNE
ncbi:ABC transporter substrate-binding protein [Paenibacillus dokdonensis]|uniref:ABC transporter substrate-binding protein n=1 Tax=Paenibacillus dokdonensis TaxID=2567944 RepID=A0ABU6GW70_9BACL|nr:ABC transporter substrate-binding protein [Paenibacillus dokdonensis]MEC0242621.1 ABC transporter substrate-binding protein [Paenibacillus dokdonensis]